MFCLGLFFGLSQGLIRRFQPVIEERIAGGPELYQAEKDKYFQEAWSGEPFKNKVRGGTITSWVKGEGGLQQQHAPPSKKVPFW